LVFFNPGLVIDYCCAGLTALLIHISSLTLGDYRAPRTSY